MVSLTKTLTQCGDIVRGGVDPQGPKIKKIQSRLKNSISLESFNLTFKIPPKKIGVWWVSGIEIVNLA